MNPSQLKKKKISYDIYVGNEYRKPGRNKKYKNTQQPEVWLTSPGAHSSVLGDSPLYPGALQADSGGIRRQFTHLNIFTRVRATGRAGGEKEDEDWVGKGRSLI